MTTRPAPLLVLVAVLATACTDEPSTPLALPPAPGAEDGVRMECRADVRAARMSCSPAGSAAGGASADMLLGGQNRYVHLYNDSVAVDGGVFSTRVTVQNLTVQAMGTGDGTTVSPRGVRVFFHEGPTNGVEVANADGVEMFTGPAQPYFQYDGILRPRQVSPGKTWRFALHGETDSFSFTVLLIAEVPSETGFLRMERVAGEFGFATSVWVDSMLVIAVGEQTLRSFDGGVQWTVQSEEFLWDVWGERANVVAVGPAGRIRRSTNRGGTWQSVRSGSTQDLYSVWGHRSTIVAVGEAGTMVRSADGGATWQVVASGTTQLLYAVWGHDSTFVAVGYGGTIVRSTDAGATWTPVNSGTTGPLYAVWGQGDMVLVGGAPGWTEPDEECAWCGVVLRSADGGATWTPGHIETANDVTALWGSGSTLVAGMGPGGLDENGEIYRSTDGGTTWTPILSLDYHQGQRAIAGSGSLVIAVGGGGHLEYSQVVLRSTNQGLTWGSVDPGVPTTFAGTWSDGRTIIVVGTSFGARIVSSTDGGATWHRRYVAAFPNGVWGEGSTVVAAAFQGKIIRSTDRGATWDSVGSGTTRPLRDVSGTGSTVVAVGDSGTIRRSTDGGVTWTGAPSGTVRALAAVWMQGAVAIAVGASGTLLRSADAGATWAPVASGTSQNLTGVWGTGPTLVAVGAGGHIQRSTDGGVSWTPVSSGTTAAFTDVSGSGSVVVATTGTSALLRSNDGGVTWHALRAGVEGDLRTLWMANPASVIAAGDKGLILHGMR